MEIKKRHPIPEPLCWPQPGEEVDHFWANLAVEYGNAPVLARYLRETEEVDPSVLQSIKRKFDPSTANEERQRLVYSYGRRGRPRGGPPPLPSCPADLADLLDPPPGSQNRRLKFVGRKGRPDKLAQQWNQHAICIKVENALIVEQKISRAVKAVAKETGLSCSTLWKYRKESRGSPKDE